MTSRLTPWSEAASRLEPGRHCDIEHECGPGKKLRVSVSVTGWASCHCFRCGFEDRQPPPKLSLAEIQERAQRIHAASEQVRLSGNEGPSPRDYDVPLWPEPARVWLYKAGLSDAEIGRLGVWYHRRSDRVVVPVLDGSGGVLFWQARAVHPNFTAKYLSMTPKPPSLVAHWGTGAVPTLTEDMLSAIKVGMAGGLGVAALGTSLTAGTTRFLLEHGPRVNLWTDPDGPGVRARRKLAAQLRAVGLDVRLIRSSRDPKLYFIDEIKEMLS